MDTQLKMICVFSIVIDYYYRFFVNLSVSSSIDVVHKEYIDIFFVYDIIITAHTIFDLLLSEPDTQTNSLSIKEELRFRSSKFSP